MSFPDKALWIIERNSTQPLTLDGIAAACGVSRSHLAHAFGTATGVSVMQYVRARRLSAAARALAAGAPDILSVALDAGYGSHEAFTRAFRDRFQQTPESVRERRSVDGLALVGPLELRPHANVRLDPPRVVDDQIVRVVGLAERCSFDTTITIPAQWQRFMECYDAIPYKRDHIPDRRQLQRGRRRPVPVHVRRRGAPLRGALARVAASRDSAPAVCGVRAPRARLHDLRDLPQHLERGDARYWPRRG